MTDDQGRDKPRDKAQGEFFSLGDILNQAFAKAAQNSGVVLSPDTPPEKALEVILEQAERDKAHKKPSRAELKLAAAAAEIAAQPYKAQAAYMAREMVLCTFPYRDPGPVNFWIRRNGSLSLILQPGIDSQTRQPLGLPYGSIPRLFLFWLITEATRTKSRHVKTGSTLNEFIRAVGFDPKTGGGKRGDAARIKEQMLRLLRCRISFEYNEGDQKQGRQSFLNMELANAAQLWWDYKNPDQAGLFESEIILGEVFFEAITAAPVPVDLRALKALKQSPFALDIYAWVTYRVYTLQQAGQREVTIPLDLLREQFGTEHERLNNFKAALTDALAKVKTVFPQLDYVLLPQALVIRDSRAVPAVPTRDQKTRALPEPAARQRQQTISDAAHAWFHQHYAGWDIQAALADFYAWREKKGIISANIDAHFKAFVQKWAKH